jgi:hypothetical protein
VDLLGHRIDVDPSAGVAVPETTNCVSMTKSGQAFVTQIGTISKGTWIVIAITELQPESPGWRRWRPAELGRLAPECFGLGRK